MKYLFILLCLISTTFASEREDEGNACDRVVSRINAKYRELSDISARLVSSQQDGTENYSVDSVESEDCETVLSDSQIYLRQKARIEQELESLQAERKKVCPRVYPE